MGRRTKTAFLIIELLLYCSFLLLDCLSDTDTKWIKYASIFLIALFSMQSRDKVITAALCLTAAADVFLLVLDQNHAIGIMLFVTVQILYSLHLESKKILMVQLILILASCVLSAAYKQIDALAIGYISVFLLNVVHAAFYCSQNQKIQNTLFFAGLILFFCCDLCVGYYNIGSGPLWHFSRVAMWAFYLPGQILILMSAIPSQGDYS